MQQDQQLIQQKQLMQQHSYLWQPHHNTPHCPCCLHVQRTVETLEGEKQALESDNTALRKALHSLEVCRWFPSRLLLQNKGCTGTAQCYR